MVFPKKNRFFTISLLTLIFGIVLIACWRFHIFFHEDIMFFGADSLKLVFCLVLFGVALLFIQNRVMATNLEEIIKQRTTDFQKSEEKYHSLIEHASDAIYILDSTKNFTHVNNSMCKMTGYSQKELLQMKVEDIIDPEELKIDPLPNAQVHPVVRERRFVRKTGQIFTVEVNVKRFTDDMILVIARDITDRKNAEESILREKMLSDTIINSLPGIFYLQNDRGEYLRWNKNFETIMGYTSEEITHRSFKKLTVEEDQEKVTKAIEKVYSKGYAMVEARVTTKNGTIIPFLLTGSSILYENQPCLLGTGVDISSRIKAQEELKSSEHKYKLLFDSNPSPMWMIARDDMSIIAYNKAAAKLYGYTKDELLNKSASLVRPVEDLEKQKERYKRDMDDSDQSVVRHLKKDGTIIFVQIIAHDIIFEGRSVRLSLTNDITEKLKAEESLKKSEANLQTILKTTNTAYILFDLELKMLEFNESAIQFIKGQYDHEPEKGDHFSYYFPSYSFPQFINFSEEILKGNSVNHEVNYPQAGKSAFWYYVRLFPITNDNKEILGMMMALYDITDRKNAEQDLKNAYVRIQDQMDSIKDMAWKQSHLIRSPLANLKGLSNLLKDDPSNFEVLTHIQDELDRMDTIIIEMADDASDDTHL